METAPQVLDDMPAGIVLPANWGLLVKAVVGLHREGLQRSYLACIHAKAFQQPSQTLGNSSHVVPLGILHEAGDLNAG